MVPTAQGHAVFPGVGDQAAPGQAPGLTPPERVQFKLLRRRYLTPGGVGVNVAVSNSATSKAITFTRPEPDVSYGVLVTPSWGTTTQVGSKATTGFTITFGTAAPGTGSPTLDYAVVRSES